MHEFGFSVPFLITCFRELNYFPKLKEREKLGNTKVNFRIVLK